MFNKVGVRILGLVQNMAFFQCPNCKVWRVCSSAIHIMFWDTMFFCLLFPSIQHDTFIFGENGVERMAAQYGVPLLGKTFFLLMVDQPVIASPVWKISPLLFALLVSERTAGFSR